MKGSLLLCCAAKAFGIGQRGEARGSEGRRIPEGADDVFTTTITAMALVDGVF